MPVLNLTSPGALSSVDTQKRSHPMSPSRRSGSFAAGCSNFTFRVKTGALPFIKTRFVGCFVLFQIGRNIALTRLREYRRNGWIVVVVNPFREIAGQHLFLEALKEIVP